MKRAKKLNPRRVLHILMALCAAGILYFAALLFLDRQEYAEGETAYQHVRQLKESSEPMAEKAAIDFTSLAKINPDIVAWLIAEGAQIDYPIVQGKDNDYYLRHLFTGEPNKLGTLFMDYRNQENFSDRNTVIYGHNLKDGSMFSSLEKYREQTYYDRFPSMALYTPSGEFKVELFAGIISDANNELIRFEALDDDPDFPKYQKYLDSLRKTSTFNSNTIVNADDQIITFCTCSYEFDNARYALYGKLTPIQ